jgi:hypothetical protein
LPSLSDEEVANKFFENVANFKYFVTTITNGYCYPNEIKIGLNPGNACCDAVQNLLFSHLLSDDVKIEVYKAITVPVLLRDC